MSDRGYISPVAVLHGMIAPCDQLGLTGRGQRRWVDISAHRMKVT
jgi:hypothetical protein